MNQTNENQNSKLALSSIAPNMYFTKYLKILNCDDLQNITYSQMKKLYVTAVHDYKTKKISEEDFTHNSSFLWELLELKDQFISELGDVLQYTMDLGCPYCSDRQDIIITKINKYYNKNKVLVIN